MADFTDMEELVVSVPEKGIADYLREALVCYGAGAHRSCVVLTHNTLFEGLRTKCTDRPDGGGARLLSESVAAQCR